jgi:hypothetical protein
MIIDNTMFLQVFLKSNTLNISFLIQTEPKRKIYAAWWESEVGAPAVL